jgi:hypothetical protein
MPLRKNNKQEVHETADGSYETFGRLLRSRTVIFSFVFYSRSTGIQGIHHHFLYKKLVLTVLLVIKLEHN